MSKLSRTKGAAFERKVATLLRNLGWTVRRSQQAQQAWEPDIVVLDGPPYSAYLWLELTDGRTPDPYVKIKQAVRDTTGKERIPVVIWHKIREQRIWVSLALDALIGLKHSNLTNAIGRSEQLVTMEFTDFLKSLGWADGWQKKY